MKKLLYMPFLLVLFISCEEEPQDSRRIYQDTIIRLKKENDSLRYQLKQCDNWVNFLEGESKENNLKEYLYNSTDLRSINIHGLEVSRKGKIKNQNEILKILKSKITTDFKKLKGQKYHLILWNDNSEETSEFLIDSEAQNNLLEELKKIVLLNSIQGFNIDFSALQPKDAESMVAFIELINHFFKNNNSEIEISLFIPTISSNESLLKVSVYDFSVLNTLVDYYIIDNDRLSKNQNSNDDQEGNYTSLHENLLKTVDYYTNGKIPNSMLVLIMSMRENNEELNYKKLFVQENKLGGLSILEY